MTPREWRNNPCGIDLPSPILLPRSSQIYLNPWIELVFIKGTIVSSDSTLKASFARAIIAALVVRRLAIIAALATATAGRGGVGTTAPQLTISSPRFPHVRGKGHAEIISVGFFFSLIRRKDAPPWHQLAFFLGLFGKKLWWLQKRRGQNDL